jgi:beta-glucosidase
MGGEFKMKGVHVALGPVVGPLGRVAEGGRNWEGISNDRESSVFSICARGLV